MKVKHIKFGLNIKRDKFKGNTKILTKLDAGLEAKMCSSCAIQPQIYCQFLLVSQHYFTGSIRLVEWFDAENDGDDDDKEEEEEEEEECLWNKMAVANFKAFSTTSFEKIWRI